MLPKLQIVYFNANDTVACFDVNGDQVPELQCVRNGMTVAEWISMAEDKGYDCENIEMRVPGEPAATANVSEQPRVSKSTMVELVQELRLLPKDPRIDIMIAEALAGEYHDYKNVKYVCGKSESSQRLIKLGHRDLAERIRQGEFDEEADEQDKAMMLRDLEENGMGGMAPELGLEGIQPAFNDKTNVNGISINMMIEYLMVVRDHHIGGRDPLGPDLPIHFGAQATGAEVTVFKEEAINIELYNTAQGPVAMFVMHEPKKQEPEVERVPYPH